MLKKGTPTGLHDSNGVEIKIGDFLKREVTCNKDRHGAWTIFVVELRGIVPVVLYHCSEYGRMLPIGYTGSPLSNDYDQKELMFWDDLSSVRPDCEMTVLSEDSEEYKFMMGLPEKLTRRKPKGGEG